MSWTSNETTWAATIVTVVFGGVYTWITVTAQHAKNIEEVQEAIKNMFARLVILVCNAFAVGVLLSEFLSVESLKRQDVFFIIWAVCILFMSIVLKILIQLREAVRLHKETTTHLYKITDVLNHLTRTQEPVHNQKNAPD